MLEQQIAELCKTILLFEQDMVIIREQFFSLKVVTDDLVWNHIVGSSYGQASVDMLFQFFKKHRGKINRRDIQLLVFNFSSKRNQALVKDDLWQLYCPRSIAFIESILKARRAKYVYSKTYQAHYAISDLLVEITQKIIQFLKLSEKMKKNIMMPEDHQLNLKIFDPKHFQVFLNPYAPQVLIKEAEIIWRHIVKRKIPGFKNFFQFFMPMNLKTSSINPNEVHQKSILLGEQNFKTIKIHTQVYNHSQKTLKRPLYLHRN